MEKSPREDSVGSRWATSSTTNNQSNRDAEDVILLTVIRVIGLLYFYYQYQLLRNLSSYTLAIFPLAGSMIFCSLRFLLPDEFNEIPETLMYFLLILDLPRACFLTSMTLKYGTILGGVKIIAPWLAMDTVIEVIVLLLGYHSDIRRLRALSAFVLLSVLINFVLLLVVYPITLRIIHEIVSPNKQTQSRPKTDCSIKSISTKERDFVSIKNSVRSSNSHPLWSIRSNVFLNGSSEAFSGAAHRNHRHYSYTSEANLPTEVCQLIQPSSMRLRGKILAAVILALAYVFGNSCLHLSY